jgi:hypothetical protein
MLLLATEVGLAQKEIENPFEILYVLGKLTNWLFAEGLFKNKEEVPIFTLVVSTRIEAVFKLASKEEVTLLEILTPEKSAESNV